MSKYLSSPKLQATVLTIVGAALVALPMVVSAQSPCGSNLFGCEVVNNIWTNSNKTPAEIAVGIIRIAMSFLGLVAVAIMLFGGFKWMTAGGNEEKVGEAKKLIAAGIIGLIIILASFSIVTFVLSRLSNVVGISQ